MIIIVSSTALVQASGIDGLVHQLQHGGPSADNNVLSIVGPTIDTDLVTFGPFSISDQIQQFQGIDQNTQIVTSSSIEASASVKFILFFPDFSRGINLFGVVGNAQGVEHFFDRSPFFFSPHETDPNTLRDLSQAQQFLVFSQTTVMSYDNFRNTISPTQIISTKGDELMSGQIFATELVSNGGFESGFLSWAAVEGVPSDIVEVRTDQPTGVGFNDISPLVPPQGTHWAYLVASGVTNQVYIKQSIPVSGPAGSRSSQELLEFSFKAVFNSLASPNRQFQANVIFYLGTSVRRNLIYRVSGLGTPSVPAEASVIPSTLNTLTVTEDVVNTITRALQTDLDNETFNFDRVDIWFIADTNTSANIQRILIDDVHLTVSRVPSDLAQTSEFAHVVTTNPTSSGFPFTVSGSDNITQFDAAAPFFDDENPAPNSTFNPTNTPVAFHVKDVSSALDQGTIDVFIDGVQVVDGGSVTGNSPWATGIKQVLAPNDISYTFTRNPEFSPQSTVTVSGTFADFADVSNGATEIYQFVILGSGSLSASITGLADGAPPTITPITPVDLATGVSPNTALVWSTADDASGVDPLLTKLIINGSTVLQNDVAINGTFSRVANANLGFNYTYAPASPFLFGQTVTGTIIAADFSTTGPNTGTLTYHFSTTPTDTLSIENFFLAVGDSALLTTGTIASVDVTDFTYGVASGTTYLTVNGETPPGLQVVTTGTGPNLLRFEFALQPLVDFRSDLTVLVHAENQFPGTYPVIEEQIFTLRPGYEVFWPNKSQDAVGGPEALFPHITNIPVLVEALNYAKVFNRGAEFFRFLTDNVSHTDLGATIVSNVKVADLPATLNPLNTFFEYGKTIVLEVEVADLEGNQLIFTHTFTIEPNPI